MLSCSISRSICVPSSLRRASPLQRAIRWKSTSAPTRTIPTLPVVEMPTSASSKSNAQASLEEKILSGKSGEQKMRAFIAITPGLEKLLAHDINLKIKVPAKELKTEKGGIELGLTTEQLWRYALTTRIAESIRVRMASSKGPIDSFWKLEKWLKKDIEWHPYIVSGSAVPIVSATVDRSKLFHTDAIEGRVRKYAKELLQLVESRKLIATDDPLATVPQQRLHVRLVQNILTISVDATGVEFFKRGDRVDVTEAPLRETLAAAILKASGFKRGMNLWDPFCGSGSILLEAYASLLSPHYTSHLFRDFPFFYWGSHDQSAFEKLRQSLLEKEIPRDGFEQTIILGTDVNEKAIDAANSNFQRMQNRINASSSSSSSSSSSNSKGVVIGTSKEETKKKKTGRKKQAETELKEGADQSTLPSVRFEVSDFERAAALLPSTKGNFTILTNLPYGKRNEASTSLLVRLRSLLERRTDFEKVFVLCGNTTEFESVMRGKLSWQTVLKFTNGGIPVELLKLVR